MFEQQATNYFHHMIIAGGEVYEYDEIDGDNPEAAADLLTDLGWSVE